MANQCKGCGNNGFDVCERNDGRLWCNECWFEFVSKPYRGSVVYFIVDEHNRVKIGYSLNVQKRLTSLQLLSADRLTLLATEPGSRLREGALHEQFAHLHVNGEWYNGNKELLHYIATLNRKG